LSHDVNPEKFGIDAGDLVVSQCQLCRHRARPASFPVCKAFPGAIPQELLDNEADHRRPFEGDDGVRFEPRDGASTAALLNLYAALDELPGPTS
jgi:hypothetical protein